MSKNENKNNEDNNEEGKKKSNSMSTTKLLAAAFAAITASLITTRLTSYIGSVLIVGITSILIAIFSELYTRVIKKTKKFGAKIAYNAVPYDKVLPTSIAERIDEKLIDVMSTTTTMPSITPLNSPQNASHDEPDTLYQSDDNGSQKADSTVSRMHIAQMPIANDNLAQLVKSMDEDNPVQPIEPVLTDSNVSITTASNDVDIEQELSEETISEAIDNDDVVNTADDDNNSNDDKDKSGILSRLKSFFNFHIESNITKGALLFLAIAMITSAMSWVITTYVDKPSVTNVTNVTEQRVQKLSDDEKNEIKQQVKSEVSSQISQAQNDASNASNSAEDISKQIASIESRLTTLESEQKQQSSSNYSTQSSSSNQSNSNSNNTGASSNNSNVSSADINNLKNQIASLKSQLSSLQSRVDKLESNQSTNTQNNNIDSEKSGQ
jgi:TolA-binding protein